MPTTTYSDLTILHRYLAKITAFIQELVQDEGRSIVLACQVFEEHQQVNAAEPFTSEENRVAWLIHRSRDLAIDHLKYESREELKVKAIRAAIDDCI